MQLNAVFQINIIACAWTVLFNYSKIFLVLQLLQWMASFVEKANTLWNIYYFDTTHHTSTVFKDMLPLFHISNTTRLSCSISPPSSNIIKLFYTVGGLMLSLRSKGYWLKTTHPDNKPIFSRITCSQHDMIFSNTCTIFNMGIWVSFSFLQPLWDLFPSKKLIDSIFVTKFSTLKVKLWYSLPVKFHCHSHTFSDTKIWKCSLK